MTAVSSYEIRVCPEGVEFVPHRRETILVLGSLKKRLGVDPLRNAH